VGNTISTMGTPEYPSGFEYDNEDPCMKFDDALGTPQLVLGMPQRNLILRNLWFLSHYSGKDVVYLTASRPNGIQYLVNRFKDRMFYIWNYCPGSSIRGIRGAKVNNGELDVEVAEIFGRAHPDCLLIVDALVERLPECTSTTIIMKGLERQMRLVAALKPSFACLRFRCCYKTEHEPPEELSKYMNDELEYLAGKLYRFPWTKPGSPELTLITNGQERTLYDRSKIDSQMCYWNHVVRTDVHEHGISISDRGQAPWWDHCWDCAAEIAILRDYMRKTGREPSNSKVKKEANSLNRVRSIRHGFHGRYPNLPVEVRRSELSSYHRDI